MSATVCTQFFAKRLYARPFRLLSLLLVSAFLVSSCEIDIEVDVPAHIPKLAVQFNLDSRESSQAIFIGKSQGVLSSEDLWRTGTVKNAQIAIKDRQGVVRQNFVFEPHRFDPETGYYTALNTFTPQPGQEYTLLVSAPGYETIQSTLEMPDLLTNVSATFQPNNKQSNIYDHKGRLRIQFNDPAGKKDFYRITVRVIDRQGRTVSNVFQDEEEGNVLGEKVGQIELNKVFDDVWAQQGAIVFTGDIGFYGDYNGSNPPVALEITAAHITQDLYLYERSLGNYRENNPFAEPLNLHSNIKNGYGNFGGITSSIYLIQL